MYLSLYHTIGESYFLLHSFKRKHTFPSPNIFHLDVIHIIRIQESKAGMLLFFQLCYSSLIISTLTDILTFSPNAAVGYFDPMLYFNLGKIPVNSKTPIVFLNLG